MRTESIQLISNSHYLYQYGRKKILCSMIEFNYWFGFNQKEDEERFQGMMRFGKMKLTDFENMKKECSVHEIHTTTNKSSE